MSDLTFVRRIGEGGFATVDLYSIEVELNSESFRRLQRAASERHGSSSSAGLGSANGNESFSTAAIDRAIQRQGKANAIDRAIERGSFNSDDRASVAPSTTTRYLALKKMRKRIPGPMRPSYPGGPPEVRYVDVPPSWRANFMSEAILLRSLRHPNVVASYGSAVVDRPLLSPTNDLAAAISSRESRSTVAASPPSLGSEGSSRSSRTVTSSPSPTQPRFRGRRPSLIVQEDLIFLQE